MIEIKDLLLKWDSALIKEQVKKEAIKEAIEKTVSIKIEISDIEVRDNTVYLKIKPIYKNEIFLNQKDIFSNLENILGRNSPKSIR